MRNFIGIMRIDAKNIRGRFKFEKVLPLYMNSIINFRRGGKMNKYVNINGVIYDLIKQLFNRDLTELEDFGLNLFSQLIDFSLNSVISDFHENLKRENKRLEYKSY